MQNFSTPATDASKDEWLTPPAIIKSLGEFDLDPCSPIVRPWDTAKTHFDINTDGLKMPWFGRVWLNPPYGDQTFNWHEILGHPRFQSFVGTSRLVFAGAAPTGMRLLENRLRARIVYFKPIVGLDMPPKNLSRRFCDLERHPCEQKIKTHDLQKEPPWTR